MSSNDLCPIGYSTDYCRRNVPFNMDSSSKSKPANFLQVCGNKICSNNAAVPTQKGGNSDVSVKKASSSTKKVESMSRRMTFGVSPQLVNGKLKR